MNLLNSFIIFIFVTNTVISCEDGKTVLIDHICGARLSDRVSCEYQGPGHYKAGERFSELTRIEFQTFLSSYLIVDSNLPALTELEVKYGTEKGCDIVRVRRSTALRVVIEGRNFTCTKSTPATSVQTSVDVDITTKSSTPVSATSASTSSASATSASTHDSSMSARASTVHSPITTEPSLVSTMSAPVTDSVRDFLSTMSAPVTDSVRDFLSTPRPTHSFKTTVIILAAALAGTALLLIILIICHWLRIMRIKRLHLPLAHVSLESSASMTTPRFGMRRSLSDSTLDTIVSSPISSSTPAPLVSTPHRYATRFQKSLLN